MEDTAIMTGALAVQDSAASFRTSQSTLLGVTEPGFRGRICGIDTAVPSELERRLLEMGFVEGTTVEVLYQGMFRGDPIAVRVGPSTIALRRREAMAIIVV